MICKRMQKHILCRDSNCYGIAINKLRITLGVAANVHSHRILRAGNVHPCVTRIDTTPFVCALSGILSDIKIDVGRVNSPSITKNRLRKWKLSSGRDLVDMD